jgi:hypothetical protein
MTDPDDILRQHAFIRRVAGHPNIFWSARDVTRIRNYVMSVPTSVLRERWPVARKFVEPDFAATRSKLLAERGIAVDRDMQPDARRFVFRISSEDIDRGNDVIKIDGWDFDAFAQNPTVLNAHDNLALPIATSTMPWKSNKTLLAIAKFPSPGVSAESDQVAAALTAGLVRGASVAFMPKKWNFTKDPSRPLGIDFEAAQLLEWSVCSLPANPTCLVLGTVSDGKSRSALKDGSAPADAGDWQCKGGDSMPIDSSDDPYDPVAAKAAVLAKCSPAGTILPDEAQHYFLAVDISAPLDASSYKFPFCRVAVDNRMVAVKVGWRQSFTALENSDMPAGVIGAARSLVERLELRLGDVKAALRRQEARTLIESLRYLPMTAREERIAEAAVLRRSIR